MLSAAGVPEMGGRVCSGYIIAMLKSLPVLTFIVLFLLSLVYPTSVQADTEIHGKITTLSAAASKDYERCPHKVPKEVCTRCNPQLTAKFKAAKDWCGEHNVPESQCFKCHPDLTFDPLPPLKAGADLSEISHEGEDVPALEPHAVKGKVTLFDFHAVWCAPCRKVDAHVFGLMGKRNDLAVRKLNVVSWETPLAARYLKDASGLPYILVYGKSGKRVATVEGFDLKKLDKAIADAESK
jgi:thiol-disulfide isomerase/thioredoxin